MHLINQKDIQGYFLSLMLTACTPIITISGKIGNVCTVHEVNV